MRTRPGDINNGDNGNNDSGKDGTIYRDTGNLTSKDISTVKYQHVTHVQCRLLGNRFPVYVYGISLSVNITDN